MHKRFGFAFAVVAASASAAWAVPTINLPDIVLAPNTAGQTITLAVSGGDQIIGFNLVMDIGGGAQGPLMTAVSLVSPGLLFAGNNTGDIPVHPGPLPTRALAKSVATASSTLSATGNLVKITLNTTGIPLGQYQYRLSDVPGIGHSDFGPDTSNGETIEAGLNYTHPAPDNPGQQGVDFGYSLLIVGVPEPSSIAMLFVGLCALGCCAALKRRGQVASVND